MTAPTRRWTAPRLDDFSAKQRLGMRLGQRIGRSATSGRTHSDALDRPPHWVSQTGGASRDRAGGSFAISPTVLPTARPVRRRPAHRRRTPHRRRPLLPTTEPVQPARRPGPRRQIPRSSVTLPRSRTQGNAVIPSRFQATAHASERVAVVDAKPVGDHGTCGKWMRCSFHGRIAVISEHRSPRAICLWLRGMARAACALEVSLDAAGPGQVLTLPGAILRTAHTVRSGVCSTGASSDRSAATSPSGLTRLCAWRADADVGEMTPRHNRADW
jgi:hypothetical protein